MDFDETRLYYSHQALQQEQAGDAAGTNSTNQTNAAGTGTTSNTSNNDADEEASIHLGAVRRHFREFLRNYRQGPHKYLYRERLLRMHRRIAGDDNALNLLDHNTASGTAGRDSKLTVDLAHVGEYDASLLGLLLSQPAHVLPAFEVAAEDALATLLYDLQRRNNSTTSTTGPQDENNLDDIQGSDAAATAPNLQAAGETALQRHYEATLGISHIQILLRGNLARTPLRAIQSQHMNKLIKCPGIVISTSPPRSRATQLVLRCARCLDTQVIQVAAGGGSGGPFANVHLPKHCKGEHSNEQGSSSNNGNASQCGAYPYNVVPDESHFCDRQSLKLQESPEAVPTGEMPRSVMMAVERSLVDVAPPGTRVQVLAIPSLFPTKIGNAGGRDEQQQQQGVRSVYLRVVGLARDHAPGESATFTPREEEAFTLLSKRNDVYDILSRSVAPSISGSYTVDIKKAICCMLMGGSRKRLPDGVKLRGDINVLLLGDPSTAKSQFLKFTSRVAPVGIYTSGKGSSAAGLTASIVKDKRGEFYLEGGAMVLADGGIVAIDEFDKMRPNDRVAIHEAMEQQTISIAKAGITTVLNSRSSVLAAANPVFGRYDDLKSASENIDLMTTILSRFDLIFLVRDVREEERDRMICKHVMGVHISNSRGDGGLTNRRNLRSRELEEDDPLQQQSGDMGGSVSANSPDAIAENIMRVAATGVGELDVPAMKKYVQYCKSRCAPRLSEQAGDVLASSYVKIRDDVRKRSIDNSQSGAGNNDDTQAVIPITVRQLEALVRLSESLAKMRLDAQVQPEDVAEALRLFRVSTMAANAADSNGGNSNNPSVSAPLQEMERSEAFLRSRLAIGTIVNKQRLVEEAAAQGYNAMAVAKAIVIMAMRGEVQERNQGRLIKRIK